MFYKIMIGEQIQLVDQIDYIRELTDGIVIRCKPQNANGITLNGTNYHVEGLPVFPSAEYDTVSVETLTRAEYLALADELGVEVGPSVEDGALALARADYIAMMTDVDLEGLA